MIQCCFIEPVGILEYLQHCKFLGDIYYIQLVIRCYKDSVQQLDIPNESKSHMARLLCGKHHLIWIRMQYLTKYLGFFFN